MYDQDAEWVMTVTELDDGMQIQNWFAAICQIYAGNHDDSKEGPAETWDAFKEDLKSNATTFDSGFDDRFVEAFTETVEAELGAQALDTIKELHEVGQERLAADYPGLLELKRSALAQGATEAGGAAADMAALSWVTDAQRAKLDGGLGPNWPDLVRSALDDKWPPWRGSGPDGLVSFLDDWADAIIATSVPPAPPSAGAPGSFDPSALTWVTDEQVARLSPVVGPDDFWRNAVRAQLDEVYPQWKGAERGQLVTFLDQWMDTILAKVPAPPPPAGAPGSFDPSALTWVTDEQRAKLESGVGPNWPEFVRSALDEKWPPWKGSGPDDLVTFLNNWSDTIIAERVPPPPPPPPAAPAQPTQAPPDSTSTPAEPAGAAPSEAPGAAAWADFLVKNAQRCKEGTDSNWRFFTNWLRAESRSQGLETAASEFIAEVDTATAPFAKDDETAARIKARAGIFAKYGAQLGTGPQEPSAPSAEPATAAGEPAAAKPGSEVPPQPKGDGQTAEQLVNSAATEILKENPGFLDQLSREDVQQLIATVLQERTAARA